MYSTSFSMGIKALNKELHKPIYNIYGFVRLADEIVDTFHDYDKFELFKRFKADTISAIEEKISLNPILIVFRKPFIIIKLNGTLSNIFKQYGNGSRGSSI